MTEFMELDLLRAMATELRRAEDADARLRTPAHVAEPTLCEECKQNARDRAIALECAMRYAREWQRESKPREGS